MNEAGEGGGPAGGILIVDDTAPYRRLLSVLLTRHGYRVFAADSAESALLEARSRLPDLILLDVRMPGMDGYRACEALKADPRTRDIPVIFISGADDVLDKVKAFACGGVDYIAKPFADAEVLARIATHLALSGLQKDLEARVRERTRELEEANLRLNREIAERRQAEAALRELAAHHDAVREEERKRIAGEIHDELGSVLTALKMDISLLRLRAGDDDEARQRIGQMRELVDRTIRIVRQVATQLRPAALNLGIVPALEWLVEDFAARTSIACALHADGEIEMDDARATAVFRIVQESLTNVARHAHAQCVDVTLVRRDGAIELRVTDDGQGFLPAAVRADAFGLMGIGERAQVLGGTVAIDSAPGAGATIEIRMPLQGVLP